MSSVKTAALLMLYCLAGTACASSNPQQYDVPWFRKTEVLEYRSCGCADACWVVELRDRKTKRLKAKLRCDCGDLLVTYPAKGIERKLAKSCAAINDHADKMTAISQQMADIMEETNDEQ